MSQDHLAAASKLVLEQAYAQLGIEIETRAWPSERALTSSNYGELDGEVIRIYQVGKLYTNLIIVPVPVNHFDAMVFTKRRDIVVDGWESLKPLSVLMRIGSKYAEFGTQGPNVRKLPSYEEVFHTLNNSRFDVAVSTRIIGTQEIKRLGLKDVLMIEPPLQSYELFHFLHRKYENLVPDIEFVLKNMARQGEINKILVGYSDTLNHIEPRAEARTGVKGNGQ